jgi:hypothetical protein
MNESILKSSSSTNVHAWRHLESKHNIKDYYAIVDPGDTYWNEIFVLLQILTKDSVTVAVDAVVYSRIFDPTMSVCNVENAQYSTKLLAATTLRNVLGTKNMQ